MKLAKTFIVVIAFVVPFSHAEVVSFPVLACGMLNGSLVHEFSAYEGGGYRLDVEFPLYLRDPSAEAVEAKKKEWRDWDPHSGKPHPIKAGHMAVAVPMVNANVMIADVKRLQKMKDLMDQLFPLQDPYEFTPDVGKTSVEFDEAECRVVSDQKNMTVLCKRKRPFEMNGVEVQEIMTRLSTEWTQEVFIGEPEGSLVQVNRPSMRAEVVYFLPDGQRVHSVFKYAPNEEDIQCYQEGERLVPTAVMTFE